MKVPERPTTALKDEEHIAIMLESWNVVRRVLKGWMASLYIRLLGKGCQVVVMEVGFCCY